jgi:protein phosphatase 1L
VEYTGPLPNNVYIFFVSVQVMKNEEAVAIARKIKDPNAAAKQLTNEALNRNSKDDISCIVVRFRS